MRPQFDERDTQILAERESAFNQHHGPRVGDFLRTQDGLLRFTHDWDDSLQTTCKQFGNGSFYLGKGYASYSGALDSAILKTKLRDTGMTELGAFWFFHHDYCTAHNGVECKFPCRVYEIA